eukprot:4379605-Pyramimonas_sp.AAC.2
MSIAYRVMGSAPTSIRTGTVIVCPRKAPASGNPVANPKSASYWAGTKLGDTSWRSDFSTVIAEVPQVAVTLSSTFVNELDAS